MQECRDSVPHDERWMEGAKTERPPRPEGSSGARRGPRGVQFNKTPPEETYINRKKTKRSCPTCKKSKEGTNNLQKYQTDDQRKVIYDGKLPKGDLQKVIYEGKLLKR